MCMYFIYEKCQKCNENKNCLIGNRVLLTQRFCMKTTEGGEGDWPPGSYCIFRKTVYGIDSDINRHPAGSVVWIDFRDGDSNEVSGTLPDGRYGEYTRIMFTCRSDASPDDEIILPTQKGFYLFRHGGRCQKVYYSG